MDAAGSDRPTVETNGSSGRGSSARETFDQLESARLVIMAHRALNSGTALVGAPPLRGSREHVGGSAWPSLRWFWAKGISRQPEPAHGVADRREGDGNGPFGPPAPFDGCRLRDGGRMASFRENRGHCPRRPASAPLWSEAEARLISEVLCRVPAISPGGWTPRNPCLRGPGIATVLAAVARSAQLWSSRFFVALRAAKTWVRTQRGGRDDPRTD